MIEDMMQRNFKINTALRSDSEDPEEKLKLKYKEENNE